MVRNAKVKRGRPRVGQPISLTLRADAEAWVAEQQAATGLSRSEVLRMAIDYARRRAKSMSAILAG